MSQQVDPTAADFNYDNLTGDELLLCRQCGKTFDLDYAEAVSNDDAPAPAAKCCQHIIGEFLRLQFTSFANNMVVSNNPILRAAGVKLRNEIATQRTEDGQKAE